LDAINKTIIFASQNNPKGKDLFFGEL